MDLTRYHDPERFAQVAQRHLSAFDWQPQGWIPLAVHVVNPEYGRGLDYKNCWLDPEPFFDIQVRQLADTLAVGSDVLPAIGINHLGDALVTGMFGAEQFMPEQGGAMLQDVGPTPLAVYDAIEQVADVDVPSLEAGVMPQVVEFVRYYREHLPPWVRIAAPMPTGPFSTAAELRGSAIMMDLFDQPDLCRRLLDLCAQTQINVERAARRITGEPTDQHVTNFSIASPGWRIGDDTIINLSPDMIEQFCLPVYAKCRRAFSAVGHIHFCTLEHSRYDHMFPVLARSEDVSIVSTQFGHEYYAEHLDELRGRLAVESFYGDGYPAVCRQYGTFKHWADEFVPRFKDESGLVMYCQVQSVAEGEQVWADWCAAHAL